MLRRLLCVSLSGWLCAVVGCAQFSGGDPAAMNLKDPDSAFLKKVDKDPFPRAAGAPPTPLPSAKAGR